MKNKIGYIIIIVLQILLGVFLMWSALYLDDIFYLNLEGFFYHFLFAPGAVILVMCLHYLLYKKYQNKSEFVFSGFICSFIIGNTLQCLTLLYESFPDGWLGYLVWFILATLIPSVLVGVFHFVYMFIDKRKHTVL